MLINKNPRNRNLIIRLKEKKKKWKEKWIQMLLEIIYKQRHLVGVDKWRIKKKIVHVKNIINKND